MSASIPISVLQHYAFCPRQCGYIHLEQAWDENYLTAKGDQLHSRVHSDETETRGNIRSERGVMVVSEKLGIHGKLDLLEIAQEPYALTPVEYKKGKPKVNDCDRIQLCAQAICLEEMCGIEISQGALWYWQVRKRHWVEFTEELRQLVAEQIDHIEQLFASELLPPAEYQTSCKSCSFSKRCAPKATDLSKRYVNDLFTT